MEGNKIGIVGGGKMGGALIEGMISGGLFPAAALTVADTDESRLGELARAYGVNATTDNREAVRGAEIVDPLASSRRTWRRSLPGLPGRWRRRPCSSPSRRGSPRPSSRKGSGRGCGSSGSCRTCPPSSAKGRRPCAAGAFATQADLGLARRIFDAVGITVEVEEALMDAVTGLSGSGPGYAFLIIEALRGCRCPDGARPGCRPAAFRPESPRGGEALPQGGEAACGAPGDGDLPRGDDARRPQGPGGGEAPGGADRGRRGGDASLRGAGRPEIDRVPRSSSVGQRFEDLPEPLQRIFRVFLVSAASLRCRRGLGGLRGARGSRARQPRQAA